MADDLTTVTELATAPGMAGHPSVDVALVRPPVGVGQSHQPVLGPLNRLRSTGGHDVAFGAGFDNGAAFLAAPGACGVASRP